MYKTCTVCAQKAKASLYLCAKHDEGNRFVTRYARSKNFFLTIYTLLGEKSCVWWWWCDFSKTHTNSYKVVHLTKKYLPSFRAMIEWRFHLSASSSVLSESSSITFPFWSGFVKHFPLIRSTSRQIFDTNASMCIHFDWSVVNLYRLTVKLWLAHRHSLICRSSSLILHIVMYVCKLIICHALSAVVRTHHTVNDECLHCDRILRVREIVNLFMKASECIENTWNTIYQRLVCLPLADWHTV